MHRRGRSGSVAPKSSSVGSSMAPGPSSDESSGVETDSSARSSPRLNERVSIKRTQNHRRQKRQRPSRPAVENIVDGFSICSFETIQDLTFFLEKKTLIEPCSESSSSESDFEPARPSSAKSSDTVSLSSSSKHGWKLRQTLKFVSSRTEFDESTDRSLSPESFGSQNKVMKKTKSRRDNLRLDNQSIASGVSRSSSLSAKNRRPNGDESDGKDSLNCASFSFVSNSSLPKEESQYNSSATDAKILLFDGICNSESKHDGHLSVTDGESESSVILVKEELKEPRWTATEWTKGFLLADNKSESDSAQKHDCEKSDIKKGTDSIKTSLVPSGDQTAKWTVIKETQNLLKLENASPTFGFHGSQGQAVCPLVPSESHSSSLNKFRTFQHKDLRHDLDPVGISCKIKVGVDSVTNLKSNFSRKRLDSDNSASNPRNASASNEAWSSSAKARSRDGSSGTSKGSSGAVSMTLNAAEIKHECTSPGSIRISSRQSSSRSSAGHRKSSHHPLQHTLGNGDYSSIHFSERSLRSPLVTHHAPHLNGPPIQPAAFSLGSLSIPHGLFPSSLPHLPVPGLHPSSAFLGPSAMGLHPSLMPSASLMPNPVATNPDLFQVQQELNARFLQDHRLLPLTLPHVPLTLRTEMHQHQHLHHHQHVMPAPYLPSLSGAYSMASHPLSMLQTMGPSGLDLINHSQTLSDFAERERLSKMRASLNLSDGFLPPSYVSLIPGVLPNGLTTSNMHGAFTINESKLPSMSASHLLRSLRNDQQVAPPPPPSIPTAPAAKKRGRWCAAHVEIAFRICYHKQQQQRQMHLDASATQHRHLASSNIHHFPRMIGSDMPPISLQEPTLHFGVSSFLRPTPQSLPPIDANSFLSSSSSSSLLPSTTFVSRPRLLHGHPGGMSLKSENREQELRRGGGGGGGCSSSSASSSSALLRPGVDSLSFHFAEHDRKRRLHERERENEEQNDKKMRMEASAAGELRLRSAKSEHSSSPHISFNDSKTGLIHRNGPAPDSNRTHHPPESRSPYLSSADRSSRSSIDSSKKRGHLAMPLLIDTHVVDYPSRSTPGQVFNPPHSTEATQARHHQDTAIPAGPQLTDRDRAHLVEHDQLHRNRLAQAYYAQSSAIHDGDRFRGLPPSHTGLGLSFNGLSKLDHDSFKPYANLNSSSSRLDVPKSVGDVFKSPSVMFKPNPDGLLIVTSNPGGSRLSFPMDSGGSSIAGLPPPPLVRLDNGIRLDHGILSFKRPGHYGSLSDFSSNMCGLPGGVVDSNGLGLPFR